MKKIFSSIIMSLIFANCGNNEKNVSNDVDTYLVKEIPFFVQTNPLRRITFSDRFKLYRQDNYELEHNILNDNEAELLDFTVDKYYYRNGVMFIYDAQASFHDTLQFKKDSILFNRYIFKPSASKFIRYNDTIYEIRKCKYKRQTTVESGFTNYYLNEDLGLILSKHINLNSGSVRYGTTPKATFLQNEIIKDSLFFTLQ
ncbi:hypothetical protein [Flavobacterium sp.]|uniref:hypothetical protein n=1 Tax=Flavobacterium sp. TaxID=239 RepID=UPI002634E591|nr:hypothetical protein [Flavobacterium sp.]